MQVCGLGFVVVALLRVKLIEEDNGGTFFSLQITFMIRQVFLWGKTSLYTSFTIIITLYTDTKIYISQYFAFFL